MKCDTILETIPPPSITIETGTLVSHPSHPDEILLCTYKSDNRFRGIVVYTTAPGDIGYVREYLPNGVVAFKGRITLEQFW